MKKIVSMLLVIAFLALNSGLAFAASTPDPVKVMAAAKMKSKPITYVKNAPVIKYAFIFDGKSEKNASVMEYFKQAIVKSTAPEFKAVFPQNLVYVADWTQAGIKNVSNKALNSDASVVVSLGYGSSEYLNSVKDKKKFVMTIDQYGLRTFSHDTFNPASQIAKKVINFRKLTNFNNAAILVNENYLKLDKNWSKYIKEMLGDVPYTVIPVGTNIDKVVKSIPATCDAVVFTPFFNITDDQRKELIQAVNLRKVPTFSTVGKEDVELGVLYGTSSVDFDKKLAEATSFSIKDALKGKVKKTEKIEFPDEEIIYLNRDTADEIGHQPHLRVLNTGKVISNKKPVEYSLSDVFSMLEKQNLDIERKKLTLKAARRSSLSAMLRYLPTFSTAIGFQAYNQSYAESAKLLYPQKTGIFRMSLDQVIYSPALVTNILIKKKQVNFQKSELLLTEQSMGLEVALLYIETLMLENMIKVQEEYVQEAQDNLAIARVREKMGNCGKEEALRWAAQLNVNQKKLLELTAAYRNVKVEINKLLFNDQKSDFALKELKTDDPAFYTSELNIIDYVSTPQTLAQFTDMLIEEAYRVAPELAKLKAAIKMKDYESRMYIQKFFLPDAKISLQYQDLIDPRYAGDVVIPFYSPMTGLVYNSMGHAKTSSASLGLFAQWTPIEGGTKFAEISRVKAERAELQKYMDEAKTEIEEHVREVINRAVAAYFMVEANYKAMYAAGENYYQVKDMYLKNKAPIAQVIDAQDIYLQSKADALNARYVFFKELVWLQRGICATNWNNASPEAKKFIENVKSNIQKIGDIAL